MPGDARGAAWAAGRVGRAVRSGVLAALTVTLAAGAHGYSCGTAPSTPIVAVGFLLTWRVGWGLAAQRLRFARLSGLVLAAQAALHLGFVLSAAGGEHTMPAPAAPGAGMMDGRLDLLPGGPTMALAHVAAACCLAWWLAIGERLLWRVARGAAALARRAVSRLRRRPPTVASPGGSRRQPVAPRVTAPRLLELRHALVRRGPPLVAAA